MSEKTTKSTAINNGIVNNPFGTVLGFIVQRNGIIRSKGVYVKNKRKKYEKVNR